MTVYRPWQKSPPEVAAKKLLSSDWDYKIPVDVFGIAEKHGVRVEASEEVAQEGLSGKVCIKDNTPIISYNPYDTEVRQRFTVAHELGHLVLGHVRTGTCHRDPRKHYTTEEFDPNERDANVFAATLLMPVAAVSVALQHINDVSIDKLAKLFKVSKIAMEIRLKSMGILPEWM